MVGSPSAELLDIRDSTDIVRVRQLVRERSANAGFRLVDQTKLVTAASELARNTLEHGGGGTARVEVLHEGIRRAVRLTFEDHGPGIADLNLALTDGYSTGAGMGLGLSGSRRLVNEFDIWSEAGVGTRVTVVRWTT
jgi:serine/threonine-protein kinase RsbT